MKHIKLLSGSLALLAGLASTASCATNGVVLGQNFQSVIDASAPGDTLIVQPGAYPDASLVFNKPLTVLPSGTNGNTMQFLGTIQVTGAGASSFQQAYFASSVQTLGSTVSFFESYFNGNVTVVQTMGTTVSFFGGTFNGTVNVTGGKVTMKRTTLNSPLTLSSNAALEALRMTNNATVTATATTGSGTPFLAVQSWFTNTVSLSGYKVWLGYNNFTSSGASLSNLRETNCDSVLIGNKFSLTNNSSTSANVIYASGGTLKAYNNLISGDDPGDTGCNGISVNSTASEIVNNTVRCGPRGFYNTVFYRLVQANGGGPITLRGNILFLDLVSIPINCNTQVMVGVEGTGAASSMLFLSYCDLWVNSSPCGSGVPFQGVTPPPVNCLLQVNPNLAADGSLNPGSPCINAGPPESIYNNRDGTRNTMGYTGGPFWNPANFTNNNPMVFLLTGQQTVLNGVQTSIQVNAAASAGH